MYPVPFDASGQYTGTWQAHIEGSDDATNQCTVRFDIRHDPDAVVPESYRLYGTVTFLFTCPNTLDAIAYLGLPSSVEFPIAGIVAPGDGLLIGSIEMGGGDSHVIALELTGADSDDDGAMDALEGYFTGALYTDGYAAVGIEGTLEAVSID